MKNLRQKATGYLAAGLAIGGLVYWASPYVAVTRFAQSAARGETTALMDRIDIKRLRNSFARQIVRAYPVDPRLVAGLDPIARQAADLIAVAYVDAIITDHFNRDAILRTLGHSGQPTAPRASDFPLPSLRSFGGAWDIFLASGFTGPVTFVVDAPTENGSTYSLGFRLIGGSWRLVSFGLPREIIEQAITVLKARSSPRSSPVATPPR